MELYIEKEFLDNFYIDFDENPIRKIVSALFCEYGEKAIFMNIKIDSLEDLVNLKDENDFFALICSNDKPPVPVDSLKDHLFNNCTFQQSIIFMNEKKEWFKEAFNKGALCFSYDNYINEIQYIIDQLHFRIDLSDEFVGWKFLNNFKYLHFNNLTISDGYILGDKTNQKIDENILPILKNMLIEKEKINLNINILTKDLNALTDTYNHKKEKSKKVYNKLNREFAKFESKFLIILNNIRSTFDFHDRVITTNFSLMDSGKGFNLMPSKLSNSQLISETIFDKYTYNRLRKIKKAQKEYYDKLSKLETAKFKMYPEINLKN